jgi:hypothetical protein
MISRRVVRRLEMLKVGFAVTLNLLGGSYRWATTVLRHSTSTPTRLYTRVWISQPETSSIREALKKASIQQGEIMAENPGRGCQRSIIIFSRACMLALFIICGAQVGDARANSWTDRIWEYLRSPSQVVLANHLAIEWRQLDLEHRTLEAGQIPANWDIGVFSGARSLNLALSQLIMQVVVKNVQASP